MYKFCRILYRSFIPSRTKRFPSTFVSQFYQIQNQQIKDFLNRLGLSFKETSNGFVTRYCPCCPKPHNQDPTNLYTLNFKGGSGLFHCFRCSSSGSWFDFKNIMNGGTLPITSVQNSQQKLPSQKQHLSNHNALKNNQHPEISEYLTQQRKINLQTLLKYRVGVGNHPFRDFQTEEVIQLPVVYFPMFLSKKQGCVLTRVKVRAIHKKNKHYMRLLPSGGGQGLFGANTVPTGTKTLVITQGEYDAMAVHQSTGLAAVSLPNGASNLPCQVLP